jgi:hypothetical protein
MSLLGSNANRLLRLIADALGLRDLQRHPTHLDTGDIKIVIDLFPLLFPDHIYKTQIVPLTPVTLTLPEMRSTSILSFAVPFITLPEARSTGILGYALV